MSHLVQEWAEDNAPVADVYERVILIEINRVRTEAGLTPITPDNRPSVAGEVSQ